MLGWLTSRQDLEVEVVRVGVVIGTYQWPWQEIHACVLRDLLCCATCPRDITVLAAKKVLSA